MNLVQLEYFMKLAKVGSFRKAAEELYISQPAVSKQISLLEKEWGFTLFDRSYRHAKLTPAGEMMHEFCENVLFDYEETLQNAKKKSKEFASELRIGLPEGTNISNLSFILADFQNDHPEISLKVSYVPMSELDIATPEGEHDIVVDYERNLRGKNSFETRVIAKRRHIAIVSNNFAMRKNGKVTKADLADERAFVPAAKGTKLTVDYFNYICSKHEIPAKEVEVLPNIQSVLMAVKMGLGYCILDDMIEITDLNNFKVIPTREFFNVMIAWNKENTNPFIKALADKIVCEIDKDDYEDILE